MNNQEQRKLEKTIEMRLIDLLVEASNENLIEVCQVIKHAVQELCESEMRERGVVIDSQDALDVFPSPHEDNSALDTRMRYL